MLEKNGLIFLGLDCNLVTRACFLQYFSRSRRNLQIKRKFRSGCCLPASHFLSHLRKLLNVSKIDREVKVKCSRYRPGCGPEGE